MADQVVVDLIARLKTEDIPGQVKKIQEMLNKVTLSPKMDSRAQQSFSRISKEYDNILDKINTATTSKKDANSLFGSFDNIEKEFNNLQSVINSIDISKLSFGDLNVNQFSNQLKGVREEWTKAVEAFQNSDAKKSIDGLISQFQGNIAGSKGKLSEMANEFKDLKEAIKDEDISKIRNVKAALDELWSSSTSKKKTEGTNDSDFKKIKGYIDDIVNSLEKVNEAKQSMRNLESEIAKGVSGDFASSASIGQKAAQGIHEYGQEARGAIQSTLEMNTQLEQLGNRVSYFFSLTNGVMLFRRALQSAFSTIKEIDAAMTETAVVSTETLSSMWDKLPDYTDKARRLGSTISDVVRAQTLYVQQGLDMDQSMGLAEESLKMARVASIDSAKATEGMTAALRGFNMELNQTSAQRVNDVYSELAKISASSTKDLIGGMEKVASIANSANMEFETTAAFIAQIKETTQESAETAGTALKTVIARFSEVKKLYSEGELRGTDEEGSAIDVNKIATALRTTGIDLNKYFLGEVGLDDIFLELASKWNDLTDVQRRYIATQAAGSRQQSRFIAMMQDYDRTVELQQAAYNSAGSGEQQFEKTLESLQVKLNQLKDAWQNFVMNIANSDAWKSVITLATKFLEVINKVVSAIGGSSGIVKSIATIGLSFGAFGGLKAVGRGVKNKILKTYLSPEDYVTRVASQGPQAGILDTFATGTVGAAQRIGGVFRNGPRQLRSLFSFGRYGYADNTINLRDYRNEYIKDYKGLEDARQNYEIALKKSETTDSKENFQRKEDIDYYNKLQRDFNTKYKDSPESKLANTQATHSLQAYGAAALAAGVAIKTLNGYLVENNKISGKAGAILDGVGNGLSVAGSALVTILPLLNAAKVPIATLVPQIAAIAAGVAVLIVALSYLNKIGLFTSQLEAAQAAAEGFANAIESTQKELDNLQSGLNDLQSKNDAFDGLTAGTAAFTNALIAANEQVLALVNADTTGKLGYTVGENGKLELTGAEEAQEALNQQKLDYQFAKASADVSVAKQAKEKALWDAQFYIDSVQKGSGAVSSAQLSDAFSTGDLSRLVGFQNDPKIKELFATYKQANSDLAKAQTTQTALATSRAAANRGFDATQSSILNRAMQTAALNDTPGEDDRTRAKEYLDSLTSEERKALFGQDWVTDNGVDKKVKDSMIDQYAKGLAAQSTVNKLSGEIAKAYTTEAGKQLEKGFKNADSKELQKAISGELKTESLGEEVSKALLLEAQAQATEELANRATINTRLGTNLTDNDFVNYSDSQRTAVESLAAQVVLVNNEAFKEAANQLASQGENLELFGNYFGKVNFAGGAKDLLIFNKQMQALEKEAVGSSEAFSDFRNAFDDGKILSEFFTSDAFDGLKSSILDLSATGNLTGKSVENLASSCEELKDILDSGIINAEGMAKAMNAISNDQTLVRGLTEAVLKAINAATANSNAASRAQKAVEGFNEGYDYAIGENFLKTAAQSFEGSGYITANAQKYAEYLFTNPFGDGNNYEGKAKGLQNRLAPLAKENGILNFLQNEGLLNSDGSLIVGGKTSDEVIKNLAREKGYTEEFASMLWSDFLNYSPDRYTYELADRQEGWNTLLAEKKDKILSTDEIRTYGRSVGATQGQIDSWITEAEDNNDIKYWDSAAKDAYKTLNKKHITKENVYDIDTKITDVNKLKEAYSELGLSTEQADTALQQYIKDLAPEDVIDFGEGVSYTKEELDESGKSLKDIQTEVDASIYANAFTKAFEDTQINIDDSELLNAQQKIDNIQSALNSLSSTTYKVNIVPSASSINVSVDGFATGNIIVSAKTMALGGLVGSMASGGRRIKPGTSLTGELGPEIVWNGEKGYSYITGLNGPNYVELKPGDRVFNAEETKKILAESGNAKYGAMALGGIVGSNETKQSPKLLTELMEQLRGGKGGKKKGSKDVSGLFRNNEKDLKNSFEHLYNTLQDIEELQLVQKRLQEEQNQILKETNVSAQKLWQNMQKQISAYEEEKEKQKEVADFNREALEEVLASEYSEFSKYYGWNKNDNTLEVDWAGIEKLTQDKKNEDTIKAIDEFKKFAEDAQKSMDEAQDRLVEIDNSIQELIDGYKEKYLDFEEQVLDAIVKSTQDQIDNQEKISNSIDSANSKLLDSINKSLDKERRDRDNQKTEKDLAEKERRLQYLMQDTSNANALEIAQLRKELNEGYEDYTDTLIDQKISELQEQNDEASEQRKEQISLAKSSLDYQKETGLLWKEVHQLIASAFENPTTLSHDTQLYSLLQNANEFTALSAIGQQEWAQDISALAAQAETYISYTQQLEKTGAKAGKSITFTDADGAKHTGTIDKNGNVQVTENGRTATFTDVYQRYDGSYNTLESGTSQKGLKGVKWTETGTFSGSDGGNGSGSSGSSNGYASHHYVYRNITLNTHDKYIGYYDKKGNLIKTEFLKKENHSFSNNRCTSCGWEKESLTEKNSDKETSIATRGEQNESKATYWDATKGKFVYHASTGGLFDTTGLMQIDGTASAPELVLNAEDTRNFLQLKNVLATIAAGGTNISETNGDNYYEINLNVDQIANDYDVDKLATRIKKIIYDDSMYRNVKAVNRLR